MIKLYCEKLYRYPRAQEHMFTAIPVKKGELFSEDTVAVYQDEKKVPIQTKVTSRYEDGSIRYLFVRMMADLPANKGTTLECDLHADGQTTARSQTNSSEVTATPGIQVIEAYQGFEVHTDALTFTVQNNSNHIFEKLEDGNKVYLADQFEGPLLKEQNGNSYQLHIHQWNVVENGPICAILAARGSNVPDQSMNQKKIDFEIRLTAYAGKPWVEIAYRIINTSSEELDIASLVFHLKGDCNSNILDNIDQKKDKVQTDSTGCGDVPIEQSQVGQSLYHTRGIQQLEMIEENTPVSSIRTFVGSSNYKTDFLIAGNGKEVMKSVDAEDLVKEANEHYGEVFYGTFMADRTDADGGVCITVFQAQQNYPKAVKASKDGISIMLVPEGMEQIIMQPGMAREQKFLMHFHSANESIKELDNRSLIYQMPDRPVLAPKVYKEAGVMLDVFPEKLADDVEIGLMGKADAHSRSYGMLNWGDSPDPGYTKQGRGNGKSVWTNNEYDFPHSCALQYARTGVRRFLDYLFVSASHWMDVDVCHYSENPLHIGGQWEHTAGHCKNGVMVCSHEWVEGLLDYYHFSGDERGLETALGIGENVLRLLDTPMYANASEINARETGWALRTLTALYVETKDHKWLQKSEWILQSFKDWENKYGMWIAPYTDNTVIRVGFMISVAVGSVMRYYREFPSVELKDMMLRAIDDLIESCLMSNGLFYYKELPSLSRLGNNTLLLEALAIGYELTGDPNYLKPGIKTFDKAIHAECESANGVKRHLEDAVICTGGGTKTFAQSFIPLITYYKALSENDMWVCDRLFD